MAFIILIYIFIGMHSKHEVRYTAKNEKPSKVLLVCVYDTIVF